MNERTADNQGGAVQQRYAVVLDWGGKLGLAVLLIAFAVYLCGALPPLVPRTQMHEYWGLSAEAYMQATGSQPGWCWVRRLHKADCLTFTGIALLSAVTVFCYLTVIPMLLRRKERVLAVLVCLEVAVLLLAASGVLSGAGH
ncbi:MAG: hypothetical protein JXR37_24570 [Kiritimatiellae bacterium]|nr:hypothetical protein [Kiritimatiellia bacterium]